MITLTPLNYPMNRHEYYQRLCDLPGFVLLESGDQHRGRYDILSAYPYDRMTIGRDSYLQQDVMQKLREALYIKKSALDLPFQGGAIGYIAYDFGAGLLGIHSQPQTSLQDLPLLDMGIYDWAVIVDHLQQKAYLFGAHECSETKAILAEVLERWHTPHRRVSGFCVSDTFLPLISKECYRESFFNIQRYLRAGRSYQVNFTQAYHADYSGDAFSMYSKISASNPVPFSAYLNLDHSQVLSFSPERYLLKEEEFLFTSPIKGTLGRSADPVLDEQFKEQLLSCAKNRAENVMIVDLLRNDLSKIALAGSVEVARLCEVQSFNSVHHLVSDIRARCKPDLHPLDIFLSCFPGGSITGAPKLETMKIIHEQEPYARGIYCGSILYFSRHGRFDSNITIRTLVARNQLLHLAAGGGLVIDSDWEDEYRECALKISAIIKGLKV